MPHDFDGVILGDYADEDGGVAFLSDEDRRRSVYVLGRNGTGKSSLLFGMMQSDLQRSRPFALLDPHSDLAERIADSIPIEAENRTIYVDPADRVASLGFNPLDGVPREERALAAANIVAAFSHIWELNEATPRLTYYLNNSLLLLLDAPGSTLLGIQRLLVDDLYRLRLLKACSDPAVRSFWEDEYAALSERDAAQAASSLQNKVGMLLSGPLRTILGQVHSTIDFRRLLDDGHNLIVNLNKAKLGEGPVRLLGAFLTTALLQAAESRADIPENKRTLYTAYCDEFSTYAVKSMLIGVTETRKRGLAWVLSHQILSQLPPLLAKTITGTVGSLVVFRIAGDDSETLHTDLRNTELVYDQSRLIHVNIAAPINLTATPNFHAWARVLSDGMPTSTRLVAISPPISTVTGRLDAVRARSRARHMRPRTQVEIEIARFLDSPPANEVHHIVGMREQRYRKRAQRDRT